MANRRTPAVAHPSACCLREEDAAEYVSLSPMAFRREWEAGRAPPPVKLTEGRQGWSVDALDVYFEGLVKASPRLVAWLRTRGVAVDDTKGRRHPAETSAVDAVNEWDAACGGTRDAALP